MLRNYPDRAARKVFVISCARGNVLRTNLSRFQKPLPTPRSTTFDTRPSVSPRPLVRSRLGLRRVACARAFSHQCRTSARSGAARRAAMKSLSSPWTRTGFLRYHHAHGMEIENFEMPIEWVTTDQFRGRLSIAVDPSIDDRKSRISKPRPPVSTRTADPTAPAPSRRILAATSHLFHWVVRSRAASLLTSPSSLDEHPDDFDRRVGIMGFEMRAGSACAAFSVEHRPAAASCA